MTARRGWSMGFLFVAATLAACAPARRNAAGVIDPGTPRPDGGAGFDSGGGWGTDEACRKMDILFIVDDSGSMEEEQRNLAANFPRFIEVLNNYIVAGGQPLDYRLGVTTTGVNIAVTIQGFGFPVPMGVTHDGALLQECGMTRHWLERPDPDLTGTFACVAEQGTDGSGMEMPMRSVRMALTDRMGDGTNTGFLRTDALLALVILTDEDDCSNNADQLQISMASPDICDPASPTMMAASELVSTLDSVKGGRSRWATAVIAGPEDCRSEFGEAVGAYRLQEFVQLTGRNAVFSSICNGDLAGSLEDALDTFGAACDTFGPQ